MKIAGMFVEQVMKSRHPLRGLENRPDKALQHRYERRKVRQFLRDWDYADA